MKRSVRGFLRLGIVISAPFFFGSAGVAGYDVYLKLVNPTIQVTGALVPSGYVYPPFKEPNFDQPATQKGRWLSEMQIAAAVLFGIACTILISCQSIGWIAAGFSRDGAQ